jgi:tRNA C32,U32 (ribose-2'-O)-methylase TrmJ
VRKRPYHWKHFKNAVEAIADLRELGYKVYAVEQAQNSLKLGALKMEGEKMAVIFGNEVTGVEQSTIENCDGCIEIPQLGMKHSLNVSVAAGVVLWELIRAKMKSLIAMRRSKRVNCYISIEQLLRRTLIRWNRCAAGQPHKACLL